MSRARRRTERRVVIFGSDSGLRVWNAAIEAIPSIEKVVIRHPDGLGRIPRLSPTSLARARLAASEADALVALSTLLGASIGALTSVPVVAIDVGAARHAATHGILAKQLAPRLLGIPDVIIGLTDAHAEAIRKLRPFKASVRVVPQPAPILGAHWSPDRIAPYVLSAGASGRDLETLCQAATRTEIEFRLLEGGSELVPAPGSEVREPYPRNMTRYGRVASDTYFGLLIGASAAVLPLPSTDYPVGITVLLDAMAAGVPVVATSVPSVLFYQGVDTAIVVPPGDPHGLSDALEAVVSDSARAREMAMNAQRHVDATASPEVVGRVLGAVIQEVIDADRDGKSRVPTSPA